MARRSRQSDTSERGEGFDISGSSSGAHPSPEEDSENHAAAEVDVAPSPPTKTASELAAEAARRAGVTPKSEQRNLHTIDQVLPIFKLQSLVARQKKREALLRRLK